MNFKKYSGMIYGFVVGLFFWVPLVFFGLRDLPIELHLSGDMFGWDLTEVYSTSIRQSINSNTSYQIGAYSPILGLLLIYLPLIALFITAGALINKYNYQEKELQEID